MWAPRAVSRLEVVQGGQTWLKFYVLILCVVFLCSRCMFPFVVLAIFFSALAKRLAGKSISKMTYFVSSGM